MRCAKKTFAASRAELVISMNHLSLHDSSYSARARFLKGNKQFLSIVAMGLDLGGMVIRDVSPRKAQ